MMEKDAYQAHPGARFNDEEANRIAGEVTRLDPHGRGVGARDYHLSQKPEEAPCHGLFEWDNEQAADLYRDDQAREQLRSVYYVVKTAQRREQPIRAFLAVSPAPGAPKVYRPSGQVLREEAGSLQILEEARRQLQAWRDRWHTYGEVVARFSAVFETIDELLDPPGEGMGEAAD
jgi:hypothetical protein